MATINILGVQEDITAHQGNTIELRFDLTDDANLPLDMTGCLLNAQFRNAKGQVAINLSLANEKLSWVNQSLGRWRILLQPADTSLLKFDSDSDTLDLLYDVEVTHPDYGVFKPYWGTLTLQREQTRTS